MGRERLKHTKPLADALTAMRAVLGLCIAGLGLGQRKAALPTVVVAVVVSWLSDLVDGPLARHDREARTTWVGAHDAEADLAVSLGIAAYLALSGYVAAWLAAGLVAVILLSWTLHSHQLAWPFYALPYVILLGLALKEVPVFGWLAIAYLGTMLGLHRRRLMHGFLPQFFGAVASLRPALRHGGEGNGAGKSG